MSSFFRAWVSGGSVFTVCSSPAPLVHNTYDGPCDFIVDGEIDGDFMDAAAIMAAVSVRKTALTGLTFKSQTKSPGVAAQPAPPVDRSALQMTFAQLLIGLVAMGWITKAEGVAWLDGTLPVAVTGLIASLPTDQQFAALVRAKRPSVVQRLDGLVLALAALQGRSEADMDAFFVTYAAV